MASQLRPSRELLERVLGADLLTLRIERLTMDGNLTAAASRVERRSSSALSAAEVTRMATFTKAGIIDNVCARSEFSRSDATDAVDACLDIIKEVLARGETVKLTGFGNFVVRDKKARTGRNPRTGAPITISARRVVTFKAAVPLRQKLEK